MKKWPFFVAIGVAIAIILGCAAKQAPVEPPKKAHVFSLPPLERPITLSTVDDANSLCDINLAHAERLKKEILAASGQRTRENTLERMNEIYIALERILYTTSLTSYTHPDKDVREASEACERRAMEVYNALNMNPDLYAAVKAVDVASLDAPARRFVQIVLRDYERSGVNKDQSVRERLAVLSQAMVQSSQDFSRNVREDVRSIKLTPEQLAGLPEDFMAQRPADEDGLITITTNAPDLFPVLTYAKDEKTREALVRVNASRAYPANEPILTNYLQQRHEYANLVGFDSWAAYNADNKMAKNPKTIQGFIDEIAGITRPRAGEEIETFMALKRLDNPETDGFYSWDRFFYIETLKRQQHDVDSQVVRQYFPYERVKRGIMGVISQIYGVTFQQSDRPVWHDSVEAYDIYDGD
ncbi:MAG: M3 family metallopeptidase, partial [Proteobacteria bacterium]|nr:M3 family metallopeptidase [Pseudomonadota bacterium]